MNITYSCEDIYTEVLYEVKRSIAIRYSHCPKAICIVQVGNNPESNAYVNGKLRDLDYVGIPYVLQRLPESIDKDMFCNVLTAIREDSKYRGVIVQQPLPEQLRNVFLDEFIPAYRDIDGFTKDSQFEACTPKGIMMFLDTNQINLDGKTVTIINRSKLVGKPLAAMMQQRNATVTVAHSHTDIGFIKDVLIPNSDIIVTAVGKPGFIQPCDVAGEKLVIDVGITSDENGKLWGDCTRNLGLTYGYQTPVPKGVGLLTRAAFIKNCEKAVCYSAN